jgi:acetylornithine deacetylase/succinyl-diaminopimelate desuccinylase-like protein
MTSMHGNSLRDKISAVMPSVRADLEALVRIPSVSADPARTADVRRCAEAVAELFRAAGSADAAVVEEGGAPAVMARFPGPPGSPTVLLYAHHDVQPTGDPALWDSPPFEPTERGDRLYGRGAADDKAGIAAHLAAIRAYDGRPPVGVTVFIEGEEEVGSASLETLLERHRERLAADVIVIADSSNWAIGEPALTVSLRGFADVVFEVRTLDHSIHSGMAGGAAPDALTAMCRIIASLHDEAGDVAVAGLHSGPASDLVYDEARFRADTGLLDGVQLIGSGSIVERLWTKPAIIPIALDATPVANASNTLAPVATAKLNVRLAPGEDPERALAAITRHLEANAPWGAKVRVLAGDCGAPFAVDAVGPAYDAARAAFEEAWGVAPVDTGIGGSIPFIASFANTFPGASVLVTGVEDPDGRAHGANEGLHLAEFEKACLAEALLLRNLAASGPSGP